MAEAKRSLAVKQFKSQKSYELACIQKAIELLKMRIPNE
jgi:hypothetical protein